MTAPPVGSRWLVLPRMNYAGSIATVLAASETNVVVRFDGEERSYNLDPAWFSPNCMRRIDQ